LRKPSLQTVIKLTIVSEPAALIVPLTPVLDLYFGTDASTAVDVSSAQTGAIDDKPSAIAPDVAAAAPKKIRTIRSLILSHSLLLFVCR
jgi:hypothetical protein